MHVAGGTFWGYRELELVGGELHSPTVGAPEWIARIEQWDWEELESPMYDYKAYSGDAPDAFGAFIMFPWPTRLVKFQGKDNWMDVQMTFGSGYEGALRHRQRNFICFESINGFRIKNTTPGSVGKYQLVIFR